MPARFRFAWVPFVAMLLVVAIAVALGRWQTRRAVEKETVEQRVMAREALPAVVMNGEAHAAEDVEYRRVRVRGEFVDNWTVYLDNRPHHGEAGFYVVTPLKVADSPWHVLVMRGWVRRDPQNRTRIPPILLPQGVVEIEGVAKNNPPRLLQLGSADPIRQHGIVQNLDVQSFAAQSRLPMQAFVIEQTSDTRDGLSRDWPRPGSGADRHRGYAFQWYALAATAFVFFLVTGFRRGRN